MQYDQKSVRFTIYHPPADGDVKLTVKIGKVLRLHSFSRHDEGYSYSGSTYAWDGTTLWNIESNGGKDCDGRTDETRYFRWKPEFGVNERGFPMWERVTDREPGGLIDECEYACWIEPTLC